MYSKNNMNDQYQYGGSSANNNKSYNDQDQYGGYGYNSSSNNNNNKNSYDDDDQYGYNNYNKNQDNQYYNQNNNDDDNQDDLDQKGFQKRQQFQDDIFMFKKVQLPGISRTQQIKKFIVSQQTKIVITKNNKIFRWRPRVDPQFKLYQLPQIGKGDFLGILGNKDKTLNIKNVYIDAKGHHCIIVCDMGNNFYLNYRQQKIRYITKLKNVNIKSIAFHSSGDNKTDQLKSGDIVISSQNAIISILNLQIYQGQLVQNLDPSVIQLSSQYDVIAIQILRIIQNNNSRYAIILMSTVSSIYCITGPDDVTVLLKKYKDSNQKVRQFTMPRGTNSIIKVCYSKISHRPTNILWTNGNNFFLFKVPDQDQKINDNFLSNNQSIKFAKKVDLPIQKAYQITNNPINIGITDFHYYILFQQSLTIMSLVTQTIVHYQQFKGTLISDMVYETNTGVIWIYQPKGVTKLDTSKQSAQAWKLLIAQKKYKQAYTVCKAKNQNISYAAGLYADSLFDKKQYQKSAKLYVQTSRSFQQIFLKFLQVNTSNARQGLTIYLKDWLLKLDPEQRTQRCLLISWLIQLIVYQLNNMQRNKNTGYDGKSAAQVRQKLVSKQSQLQKLLQNNLDVINQNLVYLIMMSHGRIQNLINFADKKGNIQMIIIHYLSQQSYDKALDYLKNVKDSQKVSQVIYKYSHIFFRFQPQKTINLLIRSVKDFKPIKLMPGLMNIPTQKRLCGIQLLRFCIQDLRAKQKSLHNILIFFYATLPKQNNKTSQLIQMMKKGRLDFDLDFGSRLFKNYKIPQAQIIVYGRMYLFSKAVSLALQNNKQQLAKQYADKPDYQDQRKKLWIQIARHYLLKKDNPKQNMNEVIKLTKQKKALKIQDLLPYFNQNIKIQSFKDQICQSLKSYNEQINKLKMLMDKYSVNADQLKNQLRLIKNRCTQVDSSQKCQQCFKPLFSAQCYVFPCLHSFHRDCLYLALRNNPGANRLQMQKISVLRQQIKQLMGIINRKRQQQQKNRAQRDSAGFSLINALNIWGNKKQQQSNYSNTQRQQIQLKTKRDQIDTILAAQCMYCGPGVVDTIVMGFNNQSLKQSWKI